ncbi:MAG: glycosyltransferase family 4 protein [Anaerolineales bacterium]
MENMRLLFLSNFYPPYELGGYAQLSQEVGKGLQNRGHAIHVLTSRHGITSGGSENDELVTRSLFLEAGIEHYRPADFFLSRRRATRVNIRELQKSVATFQPDLILVWGMWNLSLRVPFMAEQWLPGRVAYYIASYWPMDPDPHTSYWRLPARKSLTEAIKRPMRAAAFSQLRKEEYPPQLRFRNVRCCSKYVRDTLVEGGKLPSHAGVIYGGIDTRGNGSEIAPSQAKVIGVLRLICFGRLIWDKGVHTALEAMGILKHRGLADQVQLSIVGEGHPDYEHTLRKLRGELGIDQSVRFMGRVPRNKVPELLREFDVHLFTSIWPEPMARSVMESMAEGLLVIGSEVGGQTEMLEDGRNALTFRANDPEDLADKISQALNHPRLRLQLAGNGRRTVLNRFSLDRMVDDVEDFLRSICDQQESIPTTSLTTPVEQKD